MKTFITLLLLIITIACTEKKQNRENSNIFITDSASTDDYKALYNNEKYRDSLLTQVAQKGDTLAYIEAYHLLSLSGHLGELYLYQQILAVKYKYPKAYYDMFNFFQANDNVDLRKLSIYYLLKASELGDKDAINSRDKYYFVDKPIPTAEEYFIEKDTSKFVHLKRW